MISRFAPDMSLKAKLAWLVGAFMLLLTALAAALYFYEQSIGRTPGSLYYAMCMAVLLAGGAFYFLLVKVVAVPVESLLRVVEAAGAGHEAAEPMTLEIGGRDEIGRLAGVVDSLNRDYWELRRRSLETANQANTALVSTVAQLQQRSAELNLRTAELEQALATIHRLATTDSLTSLPNRRHFDEHLADALARTRRFDKPLCMIMLDVDKFKQINDTLGHGAGDAVLVILGQIIKQRTRASDFSARLGGDEFAFILENATLAEAEALAEDLLARVRSHDFRYQEQSMAVTLSIGVAHYVGPPGDVETLYKSADDALYEAKRGGRNQVAAVSLTVEGERLRGDDVAATPHVTH